MYSRRDNFGCHFFDSLYSKIDDGPLTNAEIGRDYCNQLFRVEESLKSLTPEERFCKCLELEKPIPEAFWCWLEKLEPLKGSALSKAVTYALNQRPYMENYLLMFLIKQCRRECHLSLYCWAKELALCRYSEGSCCFCCSI